MQTPNEKAHQLPTCTHNYTKFTKTTRHSILNQIYQILNNAHPNTFLAVTHRLTYHVSLGIQLGASVIRKR